MEVLLTYNDGVEVMELEFTSWTRGDGIIHMGCQDGVDLKELEC